MNLRARQHSYMKLLYRYLMPAVDPVRAMKALPRYAGFVKDYLAYKRLPGAEPAKLIDTFPCLHDKTETTGVDNHYLYQHVWVLRRIVQSGTRRHVDVGSSVEFVSLLTSLRRVVFVDIRPPRIKLDGFVALKADMLLMPFRTDSVSSLSCLHVVEHVGLGRYGDPQDPRGTAKAATELARVLAPSGSLYVSVPVGKPRVCFNAHRIHEPSQILEYFPDLELVEFSGVDDFGVFRSNVDPAELRNCEYGCGMFWFTKKSS